MMSAAQEQKKIGFRGRTIGLPQYNHHTTTKYLPGKHQTTPPKLQCYSYYKVLLLCKELFQSSLYFQATPVPLCHKVPNLLSNSVRKPGETSQEPGRTPEEERGEGRVDKGREGCGTLETGNSCTFVHG